MAKLRPSLVGRVIGKIDNKVAVNPGDSSKQPHLRESPKRRGENLESALKEQNARSGMLNKLAGEINSVVYRYCGIIKSKDFYSRCLSHFRKARTDNRFLLLYQLTGMEAHPKYRLTKLGDQSVLIKALKGKFVVDLEVKKQPLNGPRRANCYSYELIFIFWPKGKDRGTVSVQYSDWVKIISGRPFFEFTFSAPAGTEHWLLCLRQRLGVDEMPIGSLNGEGMQIVEVGTTNKKDMALLKEMLAKKVKKPEEKTEVNVTRVKPKGFKD